MKTLITSSSILSFTKHSIGQSAQYVRELLSPLTELYGINYFLCLKNYPDMTAARLTTHPQLTEDFINNRLYQYTVADSLNNYQSGYSLQDYCKKNEVQRLCTEGHNIDHILIITRKNVGYCEFFLFGTTPDNQTIGNIYLSQRGTFDAFADYFKSKASKLIQKAEQDVLQFEESFQESWIPKTQNIFVNSYREHPLPTKKESECAQYLSIGLGLKEIADKVSVSPKTLEKHVISIKDKLQCKSLASLAVKLNQPYINFESLYKRAS